MVDEINAARFQKLEVQVQQRMSRILEGSKTNKHIAEGLAPSLGVA